MSIQDEFEDQPWLDPDATPFISIRGVTKRFGDFVAVNSVDLDIYQGELFCLLGGSGRPTLRSTRQHDVSVIRAVPAYECRKKCGLRLKT